MGYIWLHEAARELSDDLPIEVARTLRRELVDHAAAAFSAFNEGVVTHPPRCKACRRRRSLARRDEQFVICFRRRADCVGIDRWPSQGMTRVQWAALLVEASEMDVWQLSPVDLQAAHTEMTRATDTKLVRA